MPSSALRGERTVVDRCDICGHPDIDHIDGLICPETCGGCGRLLEHVADGAEAGCSACLLFLIRFGDE